MSLDPGHGPQRGRVTRLRTTRETAARRKRMEAAVELLIAALDALDVTIEDMEDDDPGEEPGDEEPSLGWTDAEARKGVPYQGPVDHTDLEDEHDGREPSLGALESHCNGYGWERNRSGDQTHWGQGDRDEREDEHDGCEPDEDGEPSLGSFDQMTDQRHSWRQKDAWWNGSDYEEDTAESGIGDEGGLAEQVYNGVL